MDKIDSQIINKTARKVIGVAAPIRREIMHILADTRSFSNHFVLKAANMVDRVCIAEGATARANTIPHLHNAAAFPCYLQGEQMPRNREIMHTVGVKKARRHDQWKDEQRQERREQPKLEIKVLKKSERN